MISIKKNKTISISLILIGLFTFALFLSLLLGFYNNSFFINKNYNEINNIDDYSTPKLHYIDESYPSNETVAIIVESSIRLSIQSAVNTYEKDLKATGYTVIKYDANITNANSLRNLLKEYYQNNNTVGAVLIGNLPSIWFKDPATGYNEVFECDLFFMDLDGDWWDINGDGIYDVHNATSGSDVHPEIYIGRIDASSRTLGSGNTADISSLLNRFHSYRKNTSKREHKALMYIDDDWQGEANGTWDNWTAWIDNAYPDHDDIHTPTSWTNETNWLYRLSNNNYEFAHLAVHTASNPAGHRFGPYESGSEGNTTATEIHTNVGGFTFYNLFCCRGADYNTTDNMATTYLFSGTYTQAIVGSTKAGGMLNGQFFYDSLAENNTFGQALIDWFQSNPNLSDINNQSWFYGLCILGDPFSTIHYDCSVPKPTITSNTHNEDVWSPISSFVRFNWTINSDMNGIDGYYYIFDQNSNTIPTGTTGTYTKINGTSFSSVGDGIWYLHVVAKDQLGNVGMIGDHFKIKIDTSGPLINLINPVNNYNSSTNSTFIVWDAVDLYNNYQASVVYDVTIPPGILLYGGINKNFTVNNLTAGMNYINISCSDIMGNWETLQFSIYVDLINPFLNITSPLTNETVENTFSITWQAFDGESGIEYTEIYSDGSLIKTVYGPFQNTTISGLDEGTHNINVTTYDWSGRSSSQTVLVKVLGAKNNIPAYSIELLLISSLIGSIAYITYKKRKSMQ